MLLQVIGEDLADVIDNVATWLVDRIMDSIRDNVYNYPESEYYERLGLNGGFLGAWEHEAVEFIGNYISVMIGMNPQLMDYNPEKHQHGNSVEDRREFMDTLIATGSEYDFGGNAALKRDYWSEIVRIVESGELDNQLERFMSAKGIVWQRA